MASQDKRQWKERWGHSTAVIASDLYLWAGRHDSNRSCVQVFNVNSGCWKQYATHGIPPLGTWGYSCVAIGDELHYFGGRSGCHGIYHNSIHTLSTSSLKWKTLAHSTSKGEVPIRKNRCGMIHLTDGEEHLLYVVGGYGPAAPLLPQHKAQYQQYFGGMLTNEQHIFSLFSNKWSSPEVAGHTPPPCSSFTLTKMGEKRAAMFGGWTGSISLRDLFILDLILNLERHSVHVTWTRISKPVDQSVKWPRARYAHAATNISDSIFVMLGDHEIDDVQNLWLCDTTDKLWKKLPLSKSVERKYHSMSVFQIGPHCLWLIVYGGFHTASTMIIELINGDSQWSVGRLMERDTLSNSAKYCEKLKEGWMNGGLPVLPCVTSRSIAEKEQKISQLIILVRKLHEFQWVTEQQQILTEQNLQQVLQQSAELQNQLDQSQSTRKKSNIELQESKQAILLDQALEENARLQQQLNQSQEAIQAALEEANQRAKQKEEEWQETCHTLERTLEEKHRTIEEQQRTIEEQQRTLEEQHRTIEEQQRTIEEQQRTIEKQQRTIEKQQRTLKLKLHAFEEQQQRTRQREVETHMLLHQLHVSKKAIQTANERAEEANQRTRDKEIEVQETVLALKEQQQRVREKEDELQNTVHALEEQQQRTREKEEVNHSLHQQLCQLQEQMAREHWMVSREEVEMTKEELGRGGWGVVKVAKFRGLRVAAKCLHQVIISRYNRRQFSREMAIASKLRHPNLLLFIGATREGELMIMTELMPTSLRKELEKAEELMTKKQIITISQDVSCGLNYMHQSRPHPVIHRDISSGNVLLEPLPNGYMRAKISDYGSANFINLISSTVGPGAPAYAAPEARFPNEHTPKMDIFSFGILMMEMSIGELPECTAVRREDQIKQVIWPDMVTLVRRCTSEQPADRPNSGDVMSVLDRM